MPNYYMGIDVSKGYADFIILDAAKQQIDDGFQLDDTAKGHERLLAYLKDFFASHPQATLYAAVESTGGYENHWYRCLKSYAKSLPIHVARINPAWITYNSKANGQSNRTDAISAKDIALYQIEHPEKVRYDEGDYPMLRRQWTAIQMLIKQKTQLFNQFEAQLYDAMPELLSFCRNGSPRWLLKLVERYPGYKQLKEAGEKGIGDIPYIPSRKAQIILSRIQKGIGYNDPVSAEILGDLATDILEITTKINQKKAFLENHYQEAQEQVDLLKTFIGIGVYSAVGLLLCIGDISRFPTKKHLASYFGLHPVYKQSGDTVGAVRMSKRGRAEARAILYMITLNAIRTNPVIKAVYQRSLAKGMHKKAAIGVCMHKVLRIVYAMLKNQTPFNPEIDLRNQLKSKPKQQKNKPSNVRRLQNYDDEAPISRRQYKKRKEQASSQDESFVILGIKAPAPSKTVWGLRKINK